MTRLQALLDWLLRMLARHLYCRRYGHSVSEMFVRAEPEPPLDCDITGRPFRSGYIRTRSCIRCRANAELKWQPHIPVRMILPPKGARA